MANTRRIVSIIIFTVFMMTSFSGISAQAPAPEPSLDCLTALLNISACLTYVEAGSNMTAPEKGCCPGLSGLIDNTPFCLCELLGNSNQYGIKINRTKSLILPSICRVTTPPVSLCSVIGVPVAGPEGSMPPASAGPISPGSAGSSPMANPFLPPGPLPGGGSGSSSSTVSALVFTVGLSCATIAIF